MSETKIKPRITFGACGCDGARIAGTARASTRTCEHRPSGAGASLAASSSADMRSPLAVLVARVAVRSTADWGYGRFGEDRGVGNVVASARPSMACGARLRPRDGRGIGATRAVRGRMQMALACPFDLLVRREQIWACTTVATPRCAVHARVVGLRRRARFAGVCAVRRLRSICGRLAATFTCGTSSCPLAMSDCGRRVGIDEDLRALALASTLVYCATLAATITEFVVSYIFHLASYTSYIPVSPHEEVRMTARARHFGSLPMVEVRVPLLNGAFRNDDANGHMCVYVCMFLCLCLCVGV